MVNYRRARVAGATYFFTAALRDRRSGLLTEHVDLLRDVFRGCRLIKPFRIDAIVVLPDHVHAVWTLPEGDADFSGRWKAIKSGFSRRLMAAGVAVKGNDRGEYDVWQRRFWEHLIRDDVDLQRHVDYVHYNPVKHGHVAAAAAWPHSSFHRYVRVGLLPENWGGDPGEGEFGE